MRDRCGFFRMFDCFSRAFAVGALALLGVCPIAAAQDGTYDTAWASGGRLQVDNLSVFDGAVLAGYLVAQPDGRLLIAGSCFNSSGGAPFCAARRLANGSVDNTFGTGGVVLYDAMPNAALLAAANAPGNKTILAGATLDGTPLVARILSNGSLDASAGHGTGFLAFPFFAPAFGSPFGEILAVYPLPDGAMFVAGTAINTDNFDFAIARVLPDLSGLDATFGNGGVRMIPFDLGGGKTDVAKAIALQSDGKIVVAGGAENQAVGQYQQAVAVRLSSGGVLDPSFGTGGKFIFADGTLDLFFSAVAIDKKDRIVLGGTMTTGTSTISPNFWVTRITANGLMVDTTFGVNGNAVVPFDIGGNLNRDEVNALALQPDGKIIAAGQIDRGFATMYAAAVRFDKQGQLDPGFGSGGKFIGTFAPAPSGGASDLANSVAIADGAIMLGGAGVDATVHFERLGIARLRLDSIFGDDFE